MNSETIQFNSTQSLEGSEKIPFHSKEITLPHYQWQEQLQEFSHKKIKLNSQLSYKLIPQSFFPTFPSSSDNKSLNPQSSLTSLIIKKEENLDDNQYETIKEKRCHFRQAPHFCNELYSQLTNFFEKNKASINCQFDETLDFLIKYQPQQQMLLENNIQKQVKIELSETTIENQLKFQKALKNLFYLYLNGDYRGINDVYSVFKKGEPDFNKSISNRYVSYKYKSKHINFDFKTVEEVEFQDNEEENIQDCLQQQSQIKKQVIYNKSKYVMQFLLKLLDEDHLEFLEIPRGLEGKIQQIKNNIRQSSKRNKMSQSQFYNHTHFDCLFLQLTSQNRAYINSNQDLIAIHESVFELKDLDDPFTLSTINVYKLIISQILIRQINFIKEGIIPQLSTHSLSFKSASKLKYFERVCDSILKLNQGEVISKF